MIDAPIWLLDKMSQHGASFPRTYLFDRQQEGMMNIDLSRRGFLRLAGAGVAATSLGALGFGGAGVQPYLARCVQTGKHHICCIGRQGTELGAAADMKMSIRRL